MEPNYGKLTLTQPDGQTTTFTLHQGSTTLGSAPDNNVVINDVSVAAQHARLDCDESGCSLVNLSIPNSVLVNGLPLDRAFLLTNDKIQIGATTLLYESSLPASNVSVEPIDVPTGGGTNGGGYEIPITDQSATSVLVPIRTGGTKRPFFFVVEGHRDRVTLPLLARYLGADQPVYGLVPPRMIDSQQLPLGAAPLAARYVNAMRSIQTDGPYRIGGYGIGGILAFEVARQLLAQRQAVDLLALLDTPYLIANPALYINHRLASVFDQIRQTIAKSAQNLFQHPQVQNAQATINTAFASQATVSVPGLAGIPTEVQSAVRTAQDIVSDQQDALNDQGVESHLWATQWYVPQIYPSRITLFLADQSPVRYTGALLGWSTIATGGISSHIVPGRHETMLRNPNVSHLAAVLSSYLT